MKKYLDLQIEVLGFKSNDVLTESDYEGPLLPVNSGSGSASE